MDALLWVGWLCTLVVLFFMILIGLFGSLALKSASWDVEFLVLAQLDWKRRGLTDRDQSVSEKVSMQRFIGPKEVDAEADLEARSKTISTIAVLVGAEDRDALQSYLDERSEALLLTALTGVFNSVRNISNLNIASRVWVARRWAALSWALWQGLAWFLPRCFRQVAKVIERYMTVATILGITGGLLVWGFSNDVTGTSVGGMAWVNFVGIVVTVATVIGLVLAVGRQFHLVLVSIVGPASTWTRKGVMTVVLVIGFALGMFTLVRTGAWAQWQLGVTRFLTESLTGTPAADWLGKIVIVAFISFMVYGALQSARAHNLKARDRITTVGVASVLTLIGVLAVFFMLDAPREVTLPALYATGVVMGFIGLLDLVFGAVEWGAKYRALRRDRVDVPVGWFRWWALWAWIGAASALLALVSVPALAYTALSRTPFHLPFTVLVMLVALVVMLSFWPGVFTVVRFVIRVHNTYTRHEFEEASARFHAAFESDVTDGPHAGIDEGAGIALGYPDPMPPIRAVLFDLDGVIRHFDPENVASIERAHELELGSIEAIAFAPHHLEEVTTGKVSRRDWVERIGVELGNALAAEEWGSQPFRVDKQVLDLADELRANGIRTAILTNGTDTIQAEAAEMNLDAHFEAVFNSAEIGWTKPEVRAFQHVLDAMQLAPHEVFFTDDSASKLAGAERLGMPTHLFEGVLGLRSALQVNVLG